MSKSRKPPPEDRPMNEQEWEEFMKEGDLRAARYGELLETLIDHPDRDEIVAREMGWDDLADAVAEEKAGRAPGGEAVDGDDEEDEGSGKKGPPFEVPDLENIGDLPEDDEDPVEAIPAYALAFEVGMRIHEALEPWSERRADRDDEIGEALGDAMIGVHIAAAKLAGGHGMGYDDESICGNIVCCKRGLEGAEQALRGLEALRGKGEVPDEVIDSLVPDVKRVADAIRGRIAELRARVWW